MSVKVTANISISPGEFFDRLTILNLKTAKLSGDKERQAFREGTALAALNPYLPREEKRGGELSAHVKALYETNQKLWEIEDDIRELDSKVFSVERLDGFDTDALCWVDDYGYGRMSPVLQDFLNLARAVYVTNDERGRLKGAINSLFDIAPEVKEYSKHNG